MHPDVLIVGGGVIGLSLARELAGQGRRVTLLERDRPGREASWAGAGILPPGHLAGAVRPLDRLRAVSTPLWPAWSRSLAEETGIDNGYLRCGGITLDDPSDPIDSLAAEWTGEGVEVERLDRSGIGRHEAAIAAEFTAALRLPQLAQVRNPRHLRALEASCRQRGVEIRSGCLVRDTRSERGRLRAVETETEQFPADQFCFCTGAWTGTLARVLGVALPIVPVRGQIALLRCDLPPFRHVLELGKRYLVPRGDGRVLVGSTEESAGFEKCNTAAGISGLLEFAVRLVPALASAEIERVWSGLRPGSSVDYPFLGRAGEFENAFVAAGHFRSGLQTSVGTALLMRQLLCGEATSIDLAPFRAG